MLAWKLTNYPRPTHLSATESLSGVSLLGTDSGPANIHHTNQTVGGGASHTCHLISLNVSDWSENYFESKRLLVLAQMWQFIAFLANFTIKLTEPVFSLSCQVFVFGVFVFTLCNELCLACDPGVNQSPGLGAVLFVVVFLWLNWPTLLPERRSME